MMEIHPFALRIPAMSGEEYDELKADIAQNGLKVPLLIFEGKVLDGRHRYQACRELGLDPKTVTFAGPDPASHVISLNLKRRNLDESQRACTVVEFLPELEAEKRKAMGRPGDPRRGNNVTSSAPGTQASPEGKRAREEAGALAGVSGATVDRVRRLKEQAPDKFEEVKAGKKKAKTASNELAAERKKSEEKAKAAPKSPPTSERQIANAQKAKTRIEKAVGSCQAMHVALDDLRVDWAVSVSTPEEIEGWIEAITNAHSALTRLKKRLKGTVS